MDATVSLVTVTVYLYHRRVVSDMSPLSVLAQAGSDMTVCVHHHHVISDIALASQSQVFRQCDGLMDIITFITVR